MSSQRITTARRMCLALLALVTLGAFLAQVWREGWPLLLERKFEQASELESRHWTLMKQTLEDLRPTFQEGVSGPLKRMVPHRTDGVVQPLWAWLVSWLPMVEEASDLWQQAAVMRLGLVLGFIFVLGVMGFRSFSYPSAVWLLVVAVWGVFLPSLHFFTGEVLACILLTCLWLACLHGLHRNSLWVYAWVGIFGALAWLTEMRLVLPILCLFTVLTTLRAIWGWVLAHFRGASEVSLWVWNDHWFGLMILAAMFFFAVGPRLAESHEKFGQAFFSFAQETRWLDSKEAAAAWQARYPTADALRRVPAGDRTSASHCWNQLGQTGVERRLLVGADQVLAEYKEEGTALLCMAGLVLFIGFLGWVATPRAAHAGQRLHPETASAVFFVLVTALVVLLEACWDASVLGLAPLRLLVLPLALSLIWAAESLLRRVRRRGGGRWLMHLYHAWMLLFSYASWVCLRASS